MRTYYDVNDWYFTKEPHTQPLTSVPADAYEVTLPHTWNNVDGQDGGADYYRGKCWYYTELAIPEKEKSGCVYLEIPAASAYCEVYVNGKKAAEHKGGYSLFRVNLTDYLAEEHIFLSVMVDNSPIDDIYPQNADFTFYGGLYRGVNYVSVPETHFDLDFYGADGFTVSSDVKDRQALVKMHAYVSNAQEGDFVLFTICDETDTVIAEISVPAVSDTYAEVELTDVHLWHGVKDPYLYNVKAAITRHNEEIDCVCARHGFRSYYVDPQKGFFLNGELTPLRGVSRHQDFLGIGNALTWEEHLKDALLIQEVGANTIRLAHYQHSQIFYDLCDEMGFILWAEIPFISLMTPGPAAHENCISQMKELIYQNYNHSSICFWGISNEISIGGSSPELVANLKDLDKLAKELDPSRLTTMAQVSALPMDSEQNLITDILSYNHYFGWYSGSVTDNEKWLDAFHNMHPDRALGISEYGCEGIISYHNDDPKAGDYSEEYQAFYHEHMAKVIDERPWLWGTHIWNMFDFGCDARDEGGVKGRNNKGLVTMDRNIKKDSFYVYQSYWSEKPMVHICSKRYSQRTADEITVKVYSNQPETELFVNGVSVGKMNADHVFKFENVKLKDGFNTVTAKAGNVSDTASFVKVSEAYAPYVLVSDDDGEGVVTNWFDNLDFTKKEVMTFDENYFSIRDELNLIIDHDEASVVLTNAISSLTGMRLKKSMLKMMGNQNLENLSVMMPKKDGIDGEAALAHINAALQKIKKN